MDHSFLSAFILLLLVLDPLGSLPVFIPIMRDVPRERRTRVALREVGIAFGVLADLFRLDAVAALFWSAIVNGFVAIPLLIGVLRTANRNQLMGSWTNGRASQFWLAVTIVLMTLAAIGVVVTSR